MFLIASYTECLQLILTCCITLWNVTIHRSCLEMSFWIKHCLCAYVHFGLCVGQWMPTTTLYLFTYSRMQRQAEKPTFSMVESGFALALFCWANCTVHGDAEAVEGRSCCILAGRTCWRVKYWKQWRLEQMRGCRGHYSELPLTHTTETLSYTLLKCCLLTHYWNALAH